MSIRFAGSRTVHERRRRRLAQENDVALVESARSRAAPNSSETPSRASSSTAFEHSPVHQLIRPQIWIHWCVAALCLGCWAGLLYIGDLAEQTDIGLRSILGIRSGRLADFFSTIMLLWAGQLALLIYWYRRKSRNDFHGRYRLWLWVGVTLQFFLAVVATETHVPFGDYMQRMWPLNVPQYRLLSWLVPVATISLAIFKLVRMEVRNCACSRALLWLTGVAGVTAAGSLVTGPFLPDRAADFLQVGSATLAHLGLAITLLFHARYVIHISNEAPPAPRKRSTVQVVRAEVRNFFIREDSGFRLPRLRLRLPRWRSGTSSAAKPQKTEGRKARSKRRAKSDTARSPQRAARDRQDVASSTDSRETRKPPQATASGDKRRLDASQTPKGPKVSMPASVDDLAASVANGEPLDEDALQGLSKKERRRLRKQARNRRRATASAP